MKNKIIFHAIAIALITVSTPVLAADNSRDIAKQLKAHQQAEEQLLQGLASGDQDKMANAAIDVAASETYLQVSGFFGNSPRLLGNLFRKNDSATSFAVRVFHKRLYESTGFQTDFGKIFSQSVNWNRIKTKVMP